MSNSVSDGVGAFNRRGSISLEPTDRIRGTEWVSKEDASFQVFPLITTDNSTTSIISTQTSRCREHTGTL